MKFPLYLVLVLGLLVAQESDTSSVDTEDAENLNEYAQGTYYVAPHKKEMGPLILDPRKGHNLCSRSWIYGREERRGERICKKGLTTSKNSEALR